MIWTDSCYIDSGPIFSREYLFHVGFEYKQYKMSYHRKNNWTDELRNDDSYGRLIPPVPLLSMGNNGSSLNYCHEVLCEFLIAQSFQKLFHNLLACNKNSAFVDWTAVYASKHVSMYMLLKWWYIVYFKYNDFAFYVCNNSKENVKRTDTRHIYNGLIFSRVYLFHVGFDWQHYKMRCHKTNIWMDEWRNDDSYVEWNHNCSPLSKGNKGSGLDYCHVVWCDLTITWFFQTIFRSFLVCNRNSLFVR